MAAPVEGERLVNGFSVIPIRVKENSSAIHYLYAKEHSVRDTSSSKPKDRTLFVLNVPPYCTEECLHRLFGDCGTVQDVHLHKKPTSGAPVMEESKYFKSEPIKGYKVAYVVFKKAVAIQRAKKMAMEEPRTLLSKDHPIVTGIQKWCQQYSANDVNVSELQAEIDQYMADFDAKVAQEAERAKEQEGQPDEDGWITVTRTGKTQATARTEIAEQKILTKEKKKRKDKELLNFYTFQLRESKRQHIADLRKKFEEDKQKISLMKAARKFRPY